MYPDLAEKSAAAAPATATMVLGVAPEKGFAYIFSPCVHVKLRCNAEIGRAHV